MQRLRIDGAFAIAGRGVLLAFDEPEDDAIAVAPGVLLEVVSAGGVVARARFRALVPSWGKEAEKAHKSGALITWEGDGIAPAELAGGSFAVAGPAT